MKKIVIFTLLFFLTAQSISYASYAVIDSDTSRILFSAAPNQQRPIASLTKMWTALVVIENAKLDEIVTVSKKAVYSEGSSIYLTEGEEITVNELLHGLLLRSGNDAAMALAEHVGGSEEGFVYLMNERARQAGLYNTTFTNPSGLHNEKHLSTAYETAKMLQIAMENETFRKISSAKHFNSSKTTWENKHKLLHIHPHAIAGKTGYTKVAGRTLATYFDIDGKEIIVVTLDEPNDWVFHTYLADRVDKTFDKRVVIEKGKYKSEDKTINIKKPISILLTDKEYKKISHTIIQPTNSIKADSVWQVRLHNSPIYQFRVKAEKTTKSK